MNLDQTMTLGSHSTGKSSFRGHVHLLVINFVPLSLRRDLGNTYAPFQSTNVIVNRANHEETFRQLEPKQFIRGPCPSPDHLWEVEMSVKLRGLAGTLLFLPGESKGMEVENLNDFILVTVEAGILKLKASIDGQTSQASSPDPLVPGQWYNLKVR